MCDGIITANAHSHILSTKKKALQQWESLRTANETHFSRIIFAPFVFGFSFGFGSILFVIIHTFNGHVNSKFTGNRLLFCHDSWEHFIFFRMVNRLQFHQMKEPKSKNNALFAIHRNDYHYYFYVWLCAACVLLVVRFSVYKPNDMFQLAILFAFIYLFLLLLLRALLLFIWNHVSYSPWWVYSDRIVIVVAVPRILVLCEFVLFYEFAICSVFVCAFFDIREDGYWTSWAMCCFMSQWPYPGTRYTTYIYLFHFGFLIIFSLVRSFVFVDDNLGALFILF